MIRKPARQLIGWRHCLLARKSEIWALWWDSPDDKTQSWRAFGLM
jgi:hypothetical protein